MSEPPETPAPPEPPATPRGTDLLPPLERRGRYRPLRTGLLLAALAITAFATGLLIFNNLLMPQFIHSTGEVRVPDLTNTTVTQAEQMLRPLGLQLGPSGERFDPNVPRGFILAQDPGPETAVRGGRRVHVVVSLGEEFSSVPELFGESLRGARLLVERAGLTVGGVTRAPSEDVGDGLVAGSDPPAETVLPRESPVSLFVSTGAGDDRYVMPELLGRDLPSARRQLESLGFRVVTEPGAAATGIVFFQNPSAGSRISRDTPIVLQGTGRPS